MTLDLRHLRHVTLLAEAGNFSRAAAQAGITQPALSRSVAGLEAELGFALFDRTAGGVVPTVAGAHFVRDAIKLLDQARQLADDAKALAAGEGGTVNIGLGPLLSSLILPDLLAMLARRLPRLNLVTVGASARELMESLAERRTEMCLFTEGPTVLSGMTTKPVGSVTIALLVRAGHPLAERKGLQWREIEQYALASGSFVGRSPVASSLPEPTIICENYHILRDLVLQSDTIWLGSMALCGGDRREAFCELDVPAFPVTRHAILLARMQQRTPSPAGREVEAEITRLLAGLD